MLTFYCIVLDHHRVIHECCLDISLVQLAYKRTIGDRLKLANERPTLDELSLEFLVQECSLFHKFFD